MSLVTILVALLIFVLVGVILSLVGVPYAWAIALIVAILYVISAAGYF